MRMLAVLLTVVSVAVGQTPHLTLRPVAQNLRIPWELHWGPDSMLWTTERAGIVSRIHPETGEQQVVLDHRSVVQERGEGGLLGLALHPAFPDSPYVYLAINLGTEDSMYRTIERWQYAASENTLVGGVEIFRITPASYGHQGCRLAFGPDGMLYITTGDNHTDGWVAQDVSSPLGKVLRLRPDGSIPSDNPIPGNPMWTYGHRNPQGLAILPDGTIYTSEHGNMIEDEVNLLVKGGNYGWPGVEGPCDEDYELAFCDTVNPLPPVYSSGVVDTDAFSGLAYYNSDRFPALGNSLLMVNLKRSNLLQMHLTADRTSIESVTSWFPYAVGRIRDIAVSPDGRIFLCTSNRDPNAKIPFPIQGDDRIYEVVLVQAEAVAQLEGPDTLRVQTYEDNTLYFSANVTNLGNAPTTITAIERVITDGPLDHAHWRLPFVIMPGMTYPVDLRYFPWEAGKHLGHVRLISSNSNNVDIFIDGTALAVSVSEGGWQDAVSVYPQPFSSSVTIEIPASVGMATLSVLTMDGREVWSTTGQGSSALEWNGTDAAGRIVPPGTYAVVITDGTTTLRSLVQKSQQ